MDVDLKRIKDAKSTEELLSFSILNLDKPAGPTSFKVADIVRRTLGLKKTGHFGTLDPLATGVLPVALNRACRLSNWFMKKDKTYLATMQLHRDVSRKELEIHMQAFVGEITQLPPVRSRVKRAERQRTVYRFELLEKEGKSARCLVECEAGTYVRKLIHDLGEQIGGAHMTGVRRTRAGIFSADDEEFVELADLESAVHDYKAGDEGALRKLLIPGEVVCRIMPVLHVREEAVPRLLQGKPTLQEDLLTEPDASVQGSVTLFAGDRFLEVARIVNEGEVVAKPQFVLT